MNNVGEKYLPIGTVVMLKAASKRLMITGFSTMAVDNKDEIYDYSRCMYPEGFLSSYQTALFNHYQIEQVYYVGLVDEEEKKFKETLATLLSNAGKDGQPSMQELVAAPFPKASTLEITTYDSQNINGTINFK